MFATIVYNGFARHIFVALGFFLNSLEDGRKVERGRLRDGRKPQTDAIAEKLSISAKCIAIRLQNNIYHMGFHCGGSCS